MADGHQSGSSSMGRQCGVCTTCSILPTQLMVGGPGFFTLPGTVESPRKKEIEKLFVPLIIEPPLVAHEGEHAFQITGEKEVVHNFIPVCKPTKVSESLEQPPASQCLPIPTLSHYFPPLAPLCVWSPAENEMSSAEGL